MDPSTCPVTTEHVVRPGTRPSRPARPHQAGRASARPWCRPPPTASPARTTPGKRLAAAALALTTAGAAGLVATTVTASAATPFSLRLNTGDSISYTDPSGNAWAGDKYFDGGTKHDAGSVPIAGTTSDRMFQSHRWGMNGYNIPVPCAGTYTVSMQFAETALQGKGKRVFDVTGEGATKISKLDVFAAAGGMTKALTKTFDVAVKDTTLNLGFVERVEDPMVSGIQVTRAQACATTPTTAPTTAAPTTAAPTARRHGRADHRRTHDLRTHDVRQAHQRRELVCLHRLLRQGVRG